MKAILIFLVCFIGFQIWYNVNQKKEPKRMYFEFRKKTKPVTMDGFLRYKGEWCPIVLNDTMAIIYVK